jgi:hypothetical protein
LVLKQAALPGYDAPSREILRTLASDESAFGKRARSVFRPPADKSMRPLRYNRQYRNFDVNLIKSLRKISRRSVDAMVSRST